MFYIINKRDQIIAADNALLSLLNVGHIDELTKEIILENIQLIYTSDEGVEFITNTGTFSYKTQTSTLSSLLGKLKLIQLSEEDTQEFSSLLIDSSNNDNTVPSLTEDDLSISEEVDDLIFVKDEAPMLEDSPENIVPSSSNIELEDLSLLDDIGINPKAEEEALTKDIAKNIDDSELFDLTIPNTPETAIDEIVLDEVTDKTSLKYNYEIEEDTTDLEKVQEEIVQEDEIETVDTAPIIIYIDEVSKNIGISSDDYNTFLNEYIDTSISLEDDLKNSDTHVRTAAITTLTQLADVLELPMVNNIISKLTTSSALESEKIVDSFYTTLSRLTVEKKSLTSEMNELQDTSSQTPADNKTDESIDIKDDNSQNNLTPLNLESIKPIHFDFQLEEAANDLSLPVELIEEFVHDFIEQAHIETEKMLVAYEKGDLDTTQKIGHMLKGASSNLRINALSDTLYNIQFCDDISQLGGFIKEYWGHFLSFEQQIDVLSNKGNN